MEHSEELNSNQQNFEVRKRKYFSSLALKLKSALELHKSYDLLARNESGEREWGNVSEHCLVVAARTEALSKFIGLSKKTEDDLVLAAGMHDFYKKNQIQKTPSGIPLSMQDYMDSEQEAAEALARAHVPQNIIDYTGSFPDAIRTVQTILTKGEHVSEEEIAALVFHYVDDYTQGSAWTKPAEINSQGRKVNDLNRRIEKAFSNPKYTSINEEDKKYFDGKTSHEVQETVGESVEQFLAKRVTETKGIQIDSKDLPTIIDEEIKKDIQAYR